jgi:hypothetical protein
MAQLSALVDGPAGQRQGDVLAGQGQAAGLVAQVGHAPRLFGEAEDTTAVHHQHVIHQPLIVAGDGFDGEIWLKLGDLLGVDGRFLLRRQLALGWLGGNFFQVGQEAIWIAFLPLAPQNAIAHRVVILALDNARIAEAGFFAEAELFRQAHHAAVAGPGAQVQPHQLWHRLQQVFAPQPQRLVAQPLLPQGRVVEDDAHGEPVGFHALPVPAHLPAQLPCVSGSAMTSR